MKSIVIIKIAAGITFLSILSASCTKEMDAISKINGQDQTTLHAYYAEDNVSKTTLSGTSVLWSPGDEIMVYQGTRSSNKFTATATETCTTTDFTGTLQYLIGSQETAPESSDIWAVYPYSAACGCDGSSVSLRVESSQTAQEGSFASGVFPSIARSNSYSLAFYNVCGGVKFTVAQKGIQKVVLRGNGSEPLAGKIKVVFQNGIPTVNQVTESVDSIVVNSPTQEGFIPDREYFIVSIPAELKSGYSLSYVNQYGRTTYKSQTASEIKRRIFGVANRKDEVGILFRDPIAKAACVEKFDIDNNGEVSFSEAGAATSLDGLFENYGDVEYFPELQFFKSVTNIKGCFNGCKKIKNVEIPSFVTILGEKAFCECDSLTILIIPSTVSVIGSEAFAKSGLIHLSIPETVNQLGDKACYECTSLLDVSIPSSIKTIADEAFNGCTNLSSVVISNGVNTIGKKSFYNTDIKEINLPSSIVIIGNRSFWNNTKFVLLEGETPPSIASVSFGTATKFYVPDDALQVYKNSEGWNDFEEYIFPISQYRGYDLSSIGTANCYIVPKSGNYKFKTTKGGTKDIIEGIKGVKVLWESFGTDILPHEGDLIKPEVSYSEDYISFSTNDIYREGNAIIAAYSDIACTEGKILWSWHIWLTDQPAEQLYYHNAGTIMDRNLGATSATSGEVSSLGLLYQWGRKDPFLSGNSILSNERAASTASWPLSVVSDISIGTISYATSHPMTYISSNKYNGDWYYTGTSSTDDTRWKSSEEKKGTYDPCPYGWRVPDISVWHKAFGWSGWFDGSFDYGKKGMDFGLNSENIMKLGESTTIWYPAAGTYLSNGNFSDGGSYGYIWSCTPRNNEIISFRFLRGSVYLANSYGREQCCSVRCMKESD